MGPKERIVKRDREDAVNPELHDQNKRRILEEGSVGHDPEVKKRVHMNNGGSGNRYRHF